MFTPGQRIIDPEFGDITADVIEALQEMARTNDPVILEAEQADIAATAGTVMRDLSFGRVVGQVHEDVFDYWTHREGLGFWKDKGNLNKFLSNNPACKVESKGRGVQIQAGARVKRYVLGGSTDGGLRFDGVKRAGKGRWGS